MTLVKRFSGLFFDVSHDVDAILSQRGYVIFRY